MNLGLTYTYAHMHTETYAHVDSRMNIPSYAHMDSHMNIHSYTLAKANFFLWW